MKLSAALCFALPIALLGCSSGECDSCGGNADASSLLNCPDTQTVDMGDVVVNEGMKSTTLDIPGVKQHNITCRCVTVIPSDQRVEIQYRPIKGMGADQQFARLMKQDGGCLGLIKIKARRVPPVELAAIENGKSWRLKVHTEKAKGSPILVASQNSAKIEPIGEREWKITFAQRVTTAPNCTVEGTQVKLSLP